ncbi:MAG: hypothetical protein AB1439_10365 [candidate division FCPU426 bacterium]
MDFSLQLPILSIPPASPGLQENAAPQAADRTTQACQSFASLLISEIFSSLSKTTQAAGSQQEEWIWSLMSQTLADTWSKQESLEIVEALKNQVQGQNP